jgi:type VI secretion system protein ImpM
MAGVSVKRVGYFGKMPKAGDFVSRNLDAKVKEGFDRWLQESLSESRAQLKEAWLGAFLTAPVWRFLLMGQFADSKSLLGVMIPSVDKVGRYFPLAVLIELSEFELDQNALATCDTVLHGFEDLLLSALSEEIDQDFFDYQVGLTARKFANKPLPQPSDPTESRFPSTEGLAQKFSELQSLGGSVWWTEGSDSRQADLLLYRGMPSSSVFASFLQDPNHFRDLEWAWDTARDLNITQQDNTAVDLTDKFSCASLHLISHRGTDHAQHNASDAVFSAEHQTVVISDGRFGTGHFAMASRVLGRVLPALLGSLSMVGDGGSGRDKIIAELDRIKAFFSTKFVGVPQSSLSSPISFAALFLSDPHGTHLFIAGDYLCLHKGRHGISQIFSTRHSGDDPTIRQDQTGHYKSVVLKLEAGDRLLLSNSSFDSPQLKDDIYEAFAAPSIGRAAKSLWQNATIKGLPGNITLAAVEFTGIAEKTSELQPDLRVE